MQLNKFSVAMSVYKNDNAAHFDRALESITKLQTIKPDEIILVVDGPVPDAINDVIDKYSAEWDLFQIIRFPQNRGLGNALKAAVEKASNEWIARMDSDDVACADRFEQQLKYIADNPEVDIVGGDITEFVDDEKNIVGKRVVPKCNKELNQYLKKRCPFNHMTVMYKKKAVLESGGYLDWFWNEDYYLWLRMHLNGCVFANTGTVLVNVRTGADMYGRRGGKKYFKSEIKLQKYMLKHKIISVDIYLTNVIKRVVVQMLLPNSVRGWVYRTFARERIVT